MVWYASYGSNLSRERFLCYIRGGRPPGAERTYAGCRDQSLPLDARKVMINRKLYFAKNSTTWQNGGVAFVKDNLDHKEKTLGCMYLITEEQFKDVIKQEIGQEENIEVDLKRIARKGEEVFKSEAWYGKILYLHKEDKIPVFTFTHENEIEKKESPSPCYLRTILAGIRETYPFMSQKELFDYCLAVPEIKNAYSKKRLKELFGEK